MNWLYILTSLATLLGFRKGIIGLRSIRSKSHPQAEISWEQYPLSPWRYETLNMAVISIHSLGIFGLTVALLISLAKNGSATIFPVLETTTSLKILLLLFSVGGTALTTYASGVTFAYHFAQQRIKPASYGISDLGMYYGGLFIPWISFSHYEVGPDGLIFLYSSYSPRLRTWVLQPPAKTFTSVLRLIEKSLPTYNFFDHQLPLRRSPLALLSTMVTLIFVALLPAVWGLMENQLWVWGYAIAAFFIVQGLGNKLITRFEGRVVAKNQKSSSL